MLFRFCYAFLLNNQTKLIPQKHFTFIQDRTSKFGTFAKAIKLPIVNPIIKEIFQDDSISPEESDLLFGMLKKSMLKKGDFLLQVNEEIDEIFYVHTGCLRNYFIDVEGKEHTLQFAVKGWWISDYIALYGKEKIPSVSYIECIKDACIYSLQKSDFDNICRDFPKVALFNIRKMEMAFASFQNRILENLNLPAKQRYLNFIAAYPDIANDVKNYHIASYLGITTESLSRIRKEIASL